MATTFTVEDVSPKNVDAISLYRRCGVAALPPEEASGQADYQIRL